MYRAFAFLAVICFATPAVGQDPLPKVPEGFKIELLLKAPDIEHPTALAVAPNGDLYYAEDPMDMRGPSNKNFDKIWMLKGGDPKKRVLIAEQLWAVMGMEVVGNKLFVLHYPYISAFTLGADGKATKREDLFTDCGPKSAPPGGFNDHVPSGIRLGMDGFLYVSIGDKGVPKMTRHANDTNPDGIEVAEGRVRKTKNGRFISLEGGGVIRFRPDGSQLEVFASGTRNHLDVPIDEHDRIYIRDNTDDGDGWWTRLIYIPRDGFHGYPWAFTKQPRETLPMVRDFGGGSPCQGWVYCDDGLPETYRGRVFHCEWGKGKILAVKLDRDGAGFKFADEINFVDPTGTGVKDFRPYSIRPTADGTGFYISDWAFSGWRQPTVAGRLYKVTYVGAGEKPAKRGEYGSLGLLISGLDHPAHTERLRVQGLLIAEGAKAAEGIKKLLSAKALGVPGRRHAAWVLGEIGGENWQAAVLELTRDADATVRAQAVRVLGQCALKYKSEPGDGGAAALKEFQTVVTRLLDVLASDSDAQVRMFAAQALPIKPAREQLRAMAKEKDDYVRFAVAMQLRRHCDWKALNEELGIGAGFPTEPAALDVLIHALADQYDLDALAVLKRFTSHADPIVRKRALEVLARQHHDRKPYAGGWWGTRPEKQAPPARNVAWEGTTIVRDVLLAALADAEPAVRKAAVDGILAMNDPATLLPLQQRFGSAKSDEEQRQILLAIGGLKQASSVEFLGGLALDEKRSDAIRAEAIAGLLQIGGPNAVDLLIRVYDQSKSADLQARAIEALGTLKAKPARPTLEKSVHHASALVRQRGVEALGKSGDAKVVALLAGRLEDSELGVKEAAVKALGELKSRDGVPALVKAAAHPDLQFEAVTALTKSPDIRALSAYLTGLQSKNATLRQACRSALSAIRAEAAPLLEQMAQRNELPASVVPELRTVYTAFAPIMQWKLIGPFPDNGKVHPPEKELKFDATYSGGAGDVKWKDRKADARFQGKINLLTLYNPNQDVVAYGYTEINSDSDREARLQLGSDDTITVWLNGVKVHEFLGTRAWKFDSDSVKISLKKGKNTLLIRCGQKSGDWAFNVGLSGEIGQYAFLKGSVKKLDIEAFRAFVGKSPGDAVRGEKLFFDLKGVACAKCHAIAGKGGVVGPDLAGIALRYKKADLITSVLEPSKQIANGYETHVITMNNGNVLTGIFKGDDGETVTLMDAEGKVHKLAKKEIDEKRITPISTMPNGLSDGMTLQDFADLIAYLEARREELKGPPGGQK